MMTVGSHNESRDTPVSGVSLCLWLSSKKEEGYQYFGVQVQLVTFLSAFRLMSNVSSLSCCFLRGASSPNSSTSLLTIRRTGR